MEFTSSLVIDLCPSGTHATTGRDSCHELFMQLSSFRRICIYLYNYVRIIFNVLFVSNNLWNISNIIMCNHKLYYCYICMHSIAYTSINIDE